MCVYNFRLITYKEGLLIIVVVKLSILDEQCRKQRKVRVDNIISKFSKVVHILYVRMLVIIG